MKKLIRVMLLVFTSIAFFYFGLNEVKIEAKYNAVELDENLSMNLRLEKGKLVVDYLDSFSKVNTLRIGDYDMYAVLNDEGEVRYYIADIFEDSAYLEGEISTKVIKAMIYNKDSLVFDINKPAYFEITYYNIDDNNIFSSEINLHNSDFALLTRNVINMQLSDDEVSDRLRASMNAESSFRSQNLKVNTLSKEVVQKSMGIQSTTHLFANANTTVTTYSQDNLTNSDDWLKVYISHYFNYNYSNGKYSDDYITQIIPKYLFFAPGVHSYVGKEYGFSIKVTYQGSNLYIADAFVYDINVKLPLDYFKDFDRATVTLKPLYQFRFNAKKKGTMSDTEWNRSFSPELSEVVYKHVNYDAPNYYLKDVQIKVTTTNIFEKNPGSIEYDPTMDFGDDVANTLYEYQGEGKLTGRTAYDLSKFRIGYDKHTKMTSNTNDYLLSGNVVIKHNNSQSMYTQQASHAPFYRQLSQNNIFSRDMSLYYYNAIMKSVTMHIRTPEVINNQNPLLIGTRTADNYIKAQIVYNPRSMDYVNESNLNVSIAADFVSDDTYYQMIFFPRGQVTVLDTVEGSYCYGPYHRRPHSLMGGTSPYEFTYTIRYPGETLYVAFSPVIDSYFTFETLGSLDTEMILHNADLQITQSEDDDSGDGLNSKIVFNAYANTAYMFKVRLKDPNAVGTFMVRLKYYPVQTLAGPGYHYNLITSNPMHAIRVYIPQDSYWRFTSLGGYYTVLGVYTDEGRFLAHSYTHIEQIGKNGMVDIYLEGGRYYIISIKMSEYIRYTHIDFYYTDLWK